MPMDLAEFVKAVLDVGAWSGCSIDGGHLQEEAVKRGILVEVPYDPTVHGENDVGAEPGESWFVFSDEFKRFAGI